MVLLAVNTNLDQWRINLYSTFDNSLYITEAGDPALSLLQHVPAC